MWQIEFCSSLGASKSHLELQFQFASFSCWSFRSLYDSADIIFLVYDIGIDLFIWSDQASFSFIYMLCDDQAGFMVQSVTGLILFRPWMSLLRGIGCGPQSQAIPLRSKTLFGLFGFATNLNIYSSLVWRISRFLDRLLRHACLLEWINWSNKKGNWSHRTALFEVIVALWFILPLSLGFCVIFLTSQSLFSLDPISFGVG